MGRLNREVFEHSRRQAARRREAARMVAFRLATGVDLENVLSSPPAELRRIVLKVERLLERERMRGGARHWSYDLNRHIALGEALGELRTALGGSAERKGSPKNKAAPEGAATIR